MGQKVAGGGCVLCSGGSWVPIEHKVAWAEAYLHTKCHLSPSSRLATTDIGRKLGGGCAPLGEGKLGPHLKQSRLGWGLPPYQAVMGKSQIKSQCQISNHSVNRFKSFNQISNPIFSSNLKSLIFVVDTRLFTDFSQQQNVIFIQPVSDHCQLLQHCLSVTQNCTACEHTQGRWKQI